MIEVIFKTDEDRQRFVWDRIVPDYFSNEDKQTIQSRQWNVFEVFIPPRWRKYARENQRYPVWLTVLDRTVK